jgi:two-component system, NarL family, nitrate/nitrite response regulator NarL
MNEIRILMADDHPLFREGLSRLLETAPEFRIVGQRATASEAISWLSTTPADVVLLDYDLGEEGGTRSIADLKRCQDQVKILMDTAGMTDGATLQIMEAGASGVFLKQSNLDQLVEAIHCVCDNGIWLDGDTVRSLVNTGSSHPTQVECPRPLPARQTKCCEAFSKGGRARRLLVN